jgi:lipopolysaccharide export system protein LptC
MKRMNGSSTAFAPTNAWLGWGVLCGVVLISGCKTRRTEADPTPPPQVILYGARVNTYEGSKLVMTGRVAKLQYQRGAGAFSASEVFLRFPRDPKPPSMTPTSPAGPDRFGKDAEWIEVRAPWMVGGTQDKTVEATDGVALRTADGMIATAQRGMYDGKTNTAEGKGAVNIEGPGYAAKGQAFFLDLDEDVLRLDDNV